MFAVLVVLAGGLLLLAALALPETLPASHRRPLKVRSIAATYVELLRDVRFVILVLVAALGMSGLFAYIAGASFVLQGHYGLDQQAFALVFGAGAVALIGATQFNVVLLRRFAPQTIVVWALAAAALAGVVFVGALVRARRRAVRLRAAGLGDPGRDGPRHSQRPGGRAVAAPRRRWHRGRTARRGPVRTRCGGGARWSGVLGNGEIALALVMTAGMVIALLALLAVGVPAAETEDDVTGDAVAEAA